VELHPGLNIIIGPNGSGKTNFLEFLYKVISIKFNELNNLDDYSGELKLNFNLLEKEFTYSFEKTIFSDEETKVVKEKLKEKLVDEKGKNQIYDNETSLSLSILNNASFWYILSPIFTGFTLPQSIQNLSKTIEYESEVVKKFKYTLAVRYKFFPEISEGIQELFKDRFNPIIYDDYDLNFDNMDLFKRLNENLKKFSPIEEIKIFPNFKFVKNKPVYRVEFMNFKFLIEDQWISWNWLSDGTKRLFYIISEVTLNKGLCFIEEPEIGVHPDQYRKILNFLKEQAEHKQILITTHAPKTLDILEDDELDRIILTRYEKDLGTKMRHLSKEEQEHAIKFMREESFFLSDFWTMTSFFDEEEEVI